MKHTVTRRGFASHTSYEWAPEPGLAFVLNVNDAGALLARYEGTRLTGTAPAAPDYVAAVIEAADLATRAHKAANALMLPTVQTMRA